MVSRDPLVFVMLSVCRVNIYVHIVDMTSIRSAKKRETTYMNLTRHSSSLGIYLDMSNVTQKEAKYERDAERLLNLK